MTIESNVTLCNSFGHRTEFLFAPGSEKYHVTLSAAKRECS